MSELNKIEEVQHFFPNDKAICISPVKSNKLERNLAIKSEENKKLKEKLRELN